MESDSIFAAAISKDHKFILDLNTGEKQLFDLFNDPGEQVNIYKRQSIKDAVPLEHRLTMWQSNNDKLAEQLIGDEKPEKVELDEHLLKQLKSLGYLQ